MITYREICRILKVNELEPRYNPKRYETVLKDIEIINSIVENKKEAEDIVNLAQIGEFGLLRIIYQ